MNRLMAAISLALSILSLPSCEKVMRFELSALMNEQNELCPRAAGDGMTMVKAELNDTCCLFVIDYDGGKYPTSFDERAKSIRAQILANINNQDFDSRTPLNELADVCKACNLPIVYVYRDDRTGVATVVKVRPSDIAD